MAAEDLLPRGKDFTKCVLFRNRQETMIADQRVLCEEDTLYLDSFVRSFRIDEWCFLYYLDLRGSVFSRVKRSRVTRSTRFFLWANTYTLILSEESGGSGKGF